MSDQTTERILAMIEQLGDRFGGVEQRLDGLRAAQDALRADMIARMDRLQDSVSALRDDIVVNLGRADRAVRHSRSLDDLMRALSDEVSAMERQIQRLQSDVRALRGES